MKIETSIYEAQGAEIVLNNRPLVGAIYNQDDDVMVVGHWPDGEEWVELFRVPGTWTHQ